MSIFLECPRVLKNAAKNEGRVGYITSGIQHRQLIKHSLLENENRLCYSTQSSTANFYPHERSWRRGNGGKMYAHGSVFFCFFFLFFFCDLIPHFPSFLSLFPSLFFCLFLRISYAGPFEPRLIVIDGLHYMYEGTTEHFWFENLTIFSYFRSLSRPSFTYYRTRVHTIITPHTTILNGIGTGKLFVLISPLGSFKKCWTAITHKYATAVERI